MDKNRPGENKINKDYLLIALSLLGLLLFSLPLASDKIFDSLFLKTPSKNMDAAIGKITDATNDTRLKYANSLTWNKTKAAEYIHSGDRIFTGENSGVQVKFIKGGDIVLGENSMVVFSKVDTIEIPNLAVGNFKVKVAGKLKIALGGEITEIDGNNSDVRVTITKNEKPKVQLVSGKAKIKSRTGKVTQLQLNKVVTIKKTVRVRKTKKTNDNEIHSSRPSQEQVSSSLTEISPESPENAQFVETEDFIATEVPSETDTPTISETSPPEAVLASDSVTTALPQKTPDPILSLNPSESPLFYTRKLYDLYDYQNKHLTLRKEPRRFVQMPVAVSWTLVGEARNISAQLSHSAEFGTVGESFMFDIHDAVNFLPKAQFKKVYIGENFYRLSITGKEWMPTQKFEIREKYFSAEAPGLRFEPRTLNILRDSAKLKIKPFWISNESGDQAIKNYVVELSPNERFDSATTNIYWTNNGGLDLTFYNPKVLFARVRGVNAMRELTTLSDVYRIDINKPALPQIPSLAQNKFQFFDDETLTLKWSTDAVTEKTLVSLFNESGQKLSSVVTRSTNHSLRALSAGNYIIKLKAQDQFGRQTSSSAIGNLKVLKRPAPPPEPFLQPRLGSNTEKEIFTRKTASEESSLAYKIGGGLFGPLNKRYSGSKIALEGAGFTMFSQEQMSQGKKNPTAFMLGLRILHWFGLNGIEGSLKTKFGDNATAADNNNVSPLQIEARYHYKIGLPFNPFSALDTSQMSMIAGYELYRNSAAGPYSPKYDMVKLGLTFAFPVASRWETGGELLYGHGLDQSKKYEIAGFLGYYLNKDWSLGAGYRVHLLEAGSDASTPAGVPYREGAAEGYSSLKWNY